MGFGSGEHAHHGMTTMSCSWRKLVVRCGVWGGLAYTLLKIVVCDWFISSCDIDFCLKLGRLILLHFVTFDSVTKMLHMSFFLFNKQNHFLLGMRLLKDITAYLCRKIVYFYEVDFCVQPLKEVGTFFCCPVYMYLAKSQTIWVPYGFTNGEYMGPIWCLWEKSGVNAARPISKPFGPCGAKTDGTHMGPFWSPDMGLIWGAHL